MVKSRKDHKHETIHEVESETDDLKYKQNITEENKMSSEESQSE